MLLPGRPLAPGARAALDGAWREVRPSAACVELDHWDARLGAASALACLVLDARGEVVARRDGALDAESAAAWLGDALAAARDLAPDSGPPSERFARAESRLSLGATAEAEQRFAALAEAAPSPWAEQARERLARLAILSGDARLARERLAALEHAPLPAAEAGRALHTRGLVEFAGREHRAAAATLGRAGEQLGRARDPEAARARFDRVRALAALGEESLALATLAPLLSTPPCDDLELRAEARRFAESLLSPTTSH